MPLDTIVMAMTGMGLINTAETKTDMTGMASIGKA